MIVNEFPCCCSAVLLSEFYSSNSFQPKKDIILNELKNYFEYYFEDESIKEYPTTFFATTNSQNQSEWEQALKELGFKPRKFASRHAKTAKDKYLNFWSLYTIPKELKPWIKVEIKQIKEENTW